MFARGAGELGGVDHRRAELSAAAAGVRPGHAAAGLGGDRARLATHRDDRQAQLYFATFDGNGQHALGAAAPQPDARPDRHHGARRCLPAYPSTLPAYSLQPVGLLPGEVVTAMVALPTVQHPGSAPDPEERRLVVASRVMGTPPALPGTMTELGKITRVVAPLHAGLLVGPHSRRCSTRTPPWPRASRSSAW